MSESLPNRLSDSLLPPCEELTSPDRKTYEDAWKRAYPILFQSGMAYAATRLFNEADRREAVHDAIVDFRARLLKRGCGKN